MRDHAHRVVIVGRDCGPVAHFKDSRHRRNCSGQQQRQRRRAVRWIARGEVVSRDAAVRTQAAVNVHQLRGAFGLPRMLLFTRQLHAHRAAHGARQQHSVCGHVVGTVAAITASGLHADHINSGFR